MTTAAKPIVVLGAGINGVAIARELLINGWPVYLVDQADIASGTTAYSSRLIHGGLRYLEYGEFSLVRESIHERQRLLRLAPQFVKPLRLYIPVSSRASGLFQSIGRFLGRAASANQAPVQRGLWLVRAGLQLYDWYCRDRSLPNHAVHGVGDPGTPPVDPQSFRWLCSYYDAQIEYPERFVLAMLRDAQQLADQQGLELNVFTYHRARLDGPTVTVYRPANEREQGASIQPAAIVNATGAWVDLTLDELRIPDSRLIGGTKGSHLLTWNAHVRDSLAGSGIYAEASDGRPVFLLPFGEMTLVGTTDLPFVDDPASAVASSAEIQYLIGAVNHIFPDARLSAEQVELHYCGVRPLPYVSDASPASITRRHFFREHEQCDVPLLSIIGGKLTTCRSLAEETVAHLLEILGSEPRGDSRQRVLPGGEDYPSDERQLGQMQQDFARDAGYSTQQVRAVWQLCGSSTPAQLALDPTDGNEADASKASVHGTNLPIGFVRSVVRNEWVTHLSDLVERRLMLLYNKDLSEECLRQLAELMCREGVLQVRQVEREVADCTERLRAHFGKHLVTSD